MIRSFLIAILLTLNLHTLWANDDLANQLKSFSKKVSTAGALNYKDDCSECAQSSSQTESLYSAHNKKSIELTVLSEERAMDVFKKLKADEDIPFNFPYEGCFARAHKMALNMDDMGIVSGKAFVEGNLYIDIKGEEIGWSYHVASLVLVKKNGKTIPTVIDPGLFDRPVSFEKWKAALLKNKKSKKTSEYFTKRFNYDPDNRHDNLNGYDEDQLEDMKLQNRNYSRMAEMMQMTQKLDSKGQK